MFREMRRKGKLMPKEDAIKILKEGEYGTLASTGENGYPYAVPLNYVYENERIYFHSAPQGHKIDNIRSNDKVSFSVVNNYKLLPDKFDAEYESVIIFGRAFEIQEEEKRHALRLLIEKYSSDFLEQGIAYIERAINSVSVIKIEMEHMTGKLGQ